MQALVRARRNRLLIEGKDDHAMSKTSENEKSSTKPNVAYISIEKLLSNKFARQLMESTPKTKPINIKCDAERRNSAWNWLERWMSASSVEPTPKPEFTTEKEEEGRKGDLASPAEAKDLSEGPLELADSKEIGLPSENEENLITYDAENFKFQACMPTASSVEDHLVQPQPVNSSSSDMKQTSDINCHLNQTKQFEAHSHTVPDALPHEPEIEAEQPEQPKRSAKRLASEELETEGKKSVRKTINPSFVAAQNKFEELSSSANSNLSSSSFHQDGVQSNIETVSSGADSGTRTRELNTSENLAPHNPKVHFAASECGTELSITSTLDSPDRSEVEAAEYGHEDKVLEQEISTPNITKDVDVEAKESPVPVPNLPDSVPEQPKILDVEDESVNSVVNAETQKEELKPDLSASDIRREMDSEKGGPACRSSPEASPRSRTTVPESQGTPSSQLSIKSRKNKTDKSGSSQKRKSLSAGKRSPLNHDSGARSSVEQLSKDHKNGKRRNSMGSARPENEDQEPRDSSSSSSLPHFMQATESARAKLNANSSPRSSPDVTDREYTKKRHSLPGANGRQGSPRIQRSTSAQQGSKANGAPAIHGIPLNFLL
ncbi:hypothetical protein Tsubulata_041020 [Turnera subulata]|uniref:DUF4005 domain-containing protein n=1 Tax=Turnera subulata TaxID=218843 RepID=A0A9Q0FY78_9ROSI|nr:hypothetical protein Tsubulata_041020 [Turnera subulata]